MNGLNLAFYVRKSVLVDVLQRRRNNDIGVCGAVLDDMIVDVFDISEVNLFKFGTVLERIGLQELEVLVHKAYFLEIRHIIESLSDMCCVCIELLDCRTLEALILQKFEVRRQFDVVEFLAHTEQSGSNEFHIGSGEVHFLQIFAIMESPHSHIRQILSCVKLSQPAIFKGVRVNRFEGSRQFYRLQSTLLKHRRIERVIFQ